MRFCLPASLRRRFAQRKAAKSNRTRTAHEQRGLERGLYPRPQRRPPIILPLARPLDSVSFARGRPQQASEEKVRSSHGIHQKPGITISQGQGIFDGQNALPKIPYGIFKYSTCREAQNGLLNVVKKDPGRASQNSLGTAEIDFAKPGAHHLVLLCFIVSKIYVLQLLACLLHLHNVDHEYFIVTRGAKDHQGAHPNLTSLFA